MFVFVGTYTHRGSDGIYVFHMDTATGALDPVGHTVGVVQPSFLALHPDRPLLYAANELPEAAGDRGGKASSFAFDPHNGALTALNEQPTHGGLPCHLTVAAQGCLLLVANYADGKITVLPILGDGSLGEAVQVIQHRGAGLRTDRQAGPHAHSITLDPSGQYALAADLGTDQVLVYRVAAEEGCLEAHDPPFACVPPGSGPRHLDFHPAGRFVYVINELGSTITGFHWDSDAGRLDPLETVPTLPADFTGDNTCADIHVHPSGRFLYGSNRGHDSLVIYAVDIDTGILEFAGHEPTRGRNPRNFGIDPTGTFLLAANQDTDSVVAFRIDEASGLLEATGYTASVSLPVCVKFLAAEGV